MTGLAIGLGMLRSASVQLHLARIVTVVIATTLGIGVCVVVSIRPGDAVGTAAAQLPIIVPPGPGGVAPRIILRHNSATVDEIGSRTLRTLTHLGRDGVSALPALNFSNVAARLGSVTNGISSTVTDSYDDIQGDVVAIYSGCLVAFFDGGWSCGLWGLRSDPDPWGFSTLYAYAIRTTILGTQAIYRGCVRAFTDDMGQTTCAAIGLRANPDPWGYSTLIGYASADHPQGTKQLYHGCLTPILEEVGYVTGCRDYGLRATSDPWGFSSVVGYAYVGTLRRGTDDHRRPRWHIVGRP
jgi:hypothetical protein